MLKEKLAVLAASIASHQEFEILTDDAAGLLVGGVCNSLTSCGMYNSPSCPSLENCIVYNEYE
jgi:hypothetical protein